MIYLAFDQASETSGYSIYHNRELMVHGKFKCEGPFFERLLQVNDEFDKLYENLAKKNPDEKIKVILEDIQQQRNVLTFKRLAQLQGSMISKILVTTGEEPELVGASQWKSFNKVKGKARQEQKRNAQAKVKELYNLDVTQDEADAILLGRYASHKEMNWG